MLRSGLDRAFARYARTGDPRALARVFDGCAPELYRLAWHLLGDRHAAEDLVQQAFVVAIEQCKSFDAQRHVLPWLCGIVTNRALHQRRQARQRAAADDAQGARVPVGETADPAAAASAREAHELVAAHVRSLPEPYRQVLLLHLVHELTPQEVADALARPDATVRTQLARGLALLRRALPVGIAGLAAGQVPVPLGLAAVRAAVLARAATVAGSATLGAAAGAAVVTFSGVLAMKKVLLGAVLLAAVFGAWSWWNAAPIEPPRVDALPRTSASAGALAAPLPDDGAASVVADQRTPAAATLDPTVAALEVLVRWSDGTPAGGIVVRCRPRPLDVETWLRVATTGDDGVARFDALPPGPANALTSRGVAADADLAAGALARTEIDLTAGTDVQGRVVDVDGQGFPGATVWMSVVPGSDDSEPVTISAADGTFTIRGAGQRHVLIATAPGFATAKEAWVGAHDDVVLTMRPAPGTVVGTVVDPKGKPVAGARVLLGMTMVNPGGVHNRLFGEVRGADIWAARFLRTDAAGRFRCEGLPPWRWPLWAGATGFAPHVGEVAVRASGETEVVARLAVGATVRGRVTDESGGAIAGEIVVAYSEPRDRDERLTLGVKNAWVEPLWARAAAWTAADGSYELTHVMPGKHQLRVWHERTSARLDRELADGETFVWDAVLALDERWRGTPLSGVLVDADGAPVESWEIRVGEPGNQHNPGWMSVGDGGQLRTNAVPAGRHRILARPCGELLGESFDLGEHAASECPLRLVVPSAQVPKARLRGRVVRPPGTANAKCHVSVVSTVPNRSLRVECDAQGDWTAGPVGRGSYRVRAFSDAFGELAIGTFDVAGSDDVDTGVCAMPVPGVLVVTAVDEGGARRPDAWFLVRPVGDDRRGGVLDVRDGIGRGNLPPGRWRIATWADTPYAAMEVDVRAGVTTDVRFVVSDGVPFVLRVAPALPRGRMRACWTTGGGPPLRELTVHEHDAGTDMPLVAPLGSYVLEVTDAAGGKASAIVELRAAGQVVELPLPLAPPKAR